MTDKLHIIDISNFIHRAFHVHGDLTTSKGFPSGAVYGTLSLLCKFISENKPTHMAICYDAQDGASIRRDMYPEYKANRVRVNAISAQEIVIRRIIELLGIYSIAASGYEADDLIATITENFGSRMPIVIVTSDKDMLQLVGPNVTMYDSMKNTTYDESTAFEKFGVKPNQISDYLALVGDKADNIPGAAGIGPKAAQDLLSRYASVDEIIRGIDTVPDKYRDKLVKSMDILKVSRQLTELIKLNPRDVEISIESMELKPTYSDELDELLTKLEFSDNTKSKVKRAVRPYG